MFLLQLLKRCRLFLTLCMHEKILCYVHNGVHRARQDSSSFMWHQPCQRCKYTTSVDIQKLAIKAIHSCRITCERSESARERRISLYKSDHQSSLKTQTVFLSIYKLYYNTVCSKSRLLKVAKVRSWALPFCVCDRLCLWHHEQDRNPCGRSAYYVTSQYLLLPTGGVEMLITD